MKLNKILNTHISAKKIPNTLIKNTQDTVYPKPLAGPEHANFRLAPANAVDYLHNVLRRNVRLN